MPIHSKRLLLCDVFQKQSRNKRKSERAPACRIIGRSFNIKIERFTAAIEHETQKNVVYVDAGDVVFAVSNARQHRLYELLLREKKLTKEQISAIPDFTNDFVLSKSLLKNQLLPKAEIDLLFPLQIKEILNSIFFWSEGEWIFSPLVRVKGDIHFKINSRQLLMNYARKLPKATIIRRFKSLQESFQLQSTAPIDIEMTPTEAFVFSRFENAELNVEKYFGFERSAGSGNFSHTLFFVVKRFCFSPRLEQSF